MLEKCLPLAKGPYCRGQDNNCSQDNNCKLSQECVEIWASCKVSIVTRQHTSCRSTGSLKTTWKSNLVS